MPRSNRIMKPTSGRPSVVYRDARGRTFDAHVVGGTDTTLDLRLTSQNQSANGILTGIEKRTGEKDTNVWY